jgi:hypothetical protein
MIPSPLRERVRVRGRLKKLLNFTLPETINSINDMPLVSGDVRPSRGWEPG